MPKRNNYMPLEFSETKRPKTETTARFVQSVNIGQETQHNAHVSYRNQVTINLNTDNPPARQTADDWSDEDDDEDLVQIGTQLEKKMYDSAAIDESFYGFANSIQTRNENTSTQAMFPQPGPSRQQQEQALDDDDIDSDILLSQLNLDALEKKAESKSAHFKPPFAVKNDDKPILMPSQMTVSNEAKLEIEKRRAAALANQVQYYCKEVEKKNKEIETISKTINNLNSQLQMKEGQVSTLKRELASTREQNEKIKVHVMEASQSSRKTEELDEKMAQLNKEIHHLKSEVTAKDHELAKLRVHRSNLSDMTPDKELDDIYRSACSMIPTTIPDDIKPLVIDEAALSIDAHNPDAPTYKTLNTLQSAVTVLVATGKLSSTIDHAALTQEVLEATLKIVKYYESLTRINNRDFEYPGIEDIYLAKVHENDKRAFRAEDDNGTTIYNFKPVVEGEFYSDIRRILALFSFLMKNEEFYKLFSNVSETFYGLIIRLLDSINYAQESWRGTGYLVTIVDMFTNIITHNVIYHQELVPKIFKMVLSNCVSNIQLLRKISTFLATVQEGSILSALCSPVPFPQVKPKGIAMHIKRHCCPLLVYGLKLTTTMRCSYKHFEFDQLLQMCLELNTFLWNCWFNEVPWLKEQPEHPCCVLRILQGLIAVQYNVVHTFLRKYHSSWRWQLDKTIDCMATMNHTLHLGSINYYNILIRLNYQQHLILQKETQNHFLSLILLVEQNSTVFTLDTTATYCVKKLAELKSPEIPSASSEDGKVIEIPKLAGKFKSWLLDE